MQQKTKKRLLTSWYVFFGIVLLFVVTFLKNANLIQATLIGDTDKKYLYWPRYFQVTSGGNVWQITFDGIHLGTLDLSCNDIKTMLEGGTVNKSHSGTSYGFSIIERWPSNEPFKNFVLPKYKFLAVTIGSEDYILSHNTTWAGDTKNIQSANINSFLDQKNYLAGCSCSGTYNFTAQLEVNGDGDTVCRKGRGTAPMPLSINTSVPVGTSKGYVLKSNVRVRLEPDCGVFYCSFDVNCNNSWNFEPASSTAICSKTQVSYSDLILQFPDKLTSEGTDSENGWFNVELYNR